MTTTTTILSDFHRYNFPWNILAFDWNILNGIFTKGLIVVFLYESAMNLKRSNKSENMLFSPTFYDQLFVLTVFVCNLMSKENLWKSLWNWQKVDKYKQYRLSKSNLHALRGHSNNTWQSRGLGLNFFCFLNSVLNAFGRKKSSLR